MVILFGLVLIAALGCSAGPRTYPVRGKVTLNDGTPVKGGGISFEAVDKSVSAKGRLDERGCFELSTFGPGDGAPAGEYRVLVIPATLNDFENLANLAIFHPRYMRYDTSGLTFTVKEQANFFQIKLDPADNRKR